MTNAKGIDVSSYQAETPPLAGLSFLIARASIGTGKDARYAHHIANAKKAGLITGAYHFNDNGSSSTNQADIFVTAAGDVDLYFVDVEGSAAFSQNQTRAFIDRVHARGKLCGLYHSASGYFDAGQDYDWIAKWSTTPPTRSWDFWQYRGSPLDLDQYHGTAAQLRAFVRIPDAPPSDVEPSMIFPQALGHVVTTTEAHIYAVPDSASAPIASTLAKGTVVRRFGSVSGWRFVQLTLGGVPSYAWLRADETDDTAAPLYVTETLPDCSVAVALEYDRVTGGSKIVFPPRQ
jgi:lysozyme